MGAGASATEANDAINKASQDELKTAITGLDEASRNKLKAALAAKKVKIHGMPVSATAMGPILLALSTGAGEMQVCNLMEGAHKTPEFLKLNGFHTVPTLEAPDGFSLGESVAIMRYLARQYAPALYPEGDAKLVARIDWCLDAISTSVYTAWAERAYPILGFFPEPADKAAANTKLKTNLDMFCATFLGKGKFVCGDTITIADYKALPLLFVLTHPVINKKAGVKLATRLETYVTDVMAAVKASGMLKTAGGFGLEEFLNTKESLPDYDGEVVVCGEGECAEFSKGAAKAEEKEGKIWGMSLSANACSCVLLAKDAGVGDLAQLNLMEGEHMKEDFVKKNPFHQIPTYESSDGFIIGESSAILRFLARNYKPELYPDDIKVRAKIDWAMDAAGTSVYKKIGYGVFYPVFGFAPAPADQKEANEACKTILEEYATTLLGDGKFVCGDKLTIAEYKVLPLLFSAAQPAVQKKAGFELPARMTKYMEDIMAAIGGSTALLTEGDYSIKSYAATKEA